MSISNIFGDESRDDGGGDGIIGVAVGLVDDNDDDAGLGRVKVRFPWRSTDETSDWVRVAAPMAGSDRGNYFLPHVDDEVLVAFENGDISRPYVIGALWNGEDRPPVEKDEQVDVRKIRTKSGHEIVFDETDSKGKIEITTSGGQKVAVDDSAGAEKIAIEDTAGQKVILDTAGKTVEVTAGSTLKLSAGTVELSGTSKVDIKSGGELSLNGTVIKLN